jgi:hypothetical protein
VTVQCYDMPKPRRSHFQTEQAFIEAMVVFITYRREGMSDFAYHTRVAMRAKAWSKTDLGRRLAYNTGMCSALTE